MKKLLIILMVVAMASFLFVGCLGTTPPIDPDEPVEPVEPVVPATVAPVITWVSDNPLDPLGQVAVISLTATAAQYVNRAESARGIIIHGTAPTYSEVKVYLNGIVAGTADTLAGSTWSVVIALSELGADGAKVLDADAIEPGCGVSVKSNAVSFILDRTLPTMTSVAAYLGIFPPHFKVGFSEDVNIDIDISAAGTPASALNFANYSLMVGTVPFTVADIFTAVSTRVVSIIDFSGNIATIGLNNAYSLECWNVIDVAGNPIGSFAFPAVIYGNVLP